MSKDFAQIDWDQQLEDDCRQLVRLAVREDLNRGDDLTTVTLIDDQRQGRAAVVVRSPGIVAGIAAVPTALDEMDVRLAWQPQASDGQFVASGQRLAELSGPARDLLTTERILLNLLARLSGIATLTRRYVESVAGHRAAIYDTRKTTPGWRRLEKYAVRCGGGRNHRTGLFDAVLIKDNHLALGRTARNPLSPRTAVEQSRRMLAELTPREHVLIEIEVDDLQQFRQVLPAHPDLVLLDNMTHDQLREAVALRDAEAPDVGLEASGGIQLETVATVAATGVDRISVGTLTHSAPCLDIGLDWID